ncbi:hypothetical protein DWB84_07010 [Saccharophagus sp. K07]|nr:hypothetical protein [Saccharophagus sp. K07]
MTLLRWRISSVLGRETKGWIMRNKYLLPQRELAGVVKSEEEIDLMLHRHAGWQRAQIVFTQKIISRLPWI